LSSSDRRYTATEIARALNIARPTAIAILSELQAAGWVSRDSNRTYSGGPRFTSTRGSGSRADEIDCVHASLATLSARLKCGLTLSAIEPTHFTVLHKLQIKDRPVTGFPVGQRNELRFPAGAVALVQRSSIEQRAWFATAPGMSASRRRSMLRVARERSVAIYRPSDEDASLLGLLADLLNEVGELNLQSSLRMRLMDQIAQLNGTMYTADEIDQQEGAPIGYLAVPVYDGNQRAAYELQIAPLSSNVSYARRRELIEAASDTALSLQGHTIPPCRHPTQRCR